MRPPEFWNRVGWEAKLLAPAGWLHGASVAWKEAHAKPYRSRAAVVCVGNLSVGGSGKTPVAIEIARMLRERGRQPVFLSRGYGGRLKGPLQVDARNSAKDVGDEPLLLAQSAPVVVARDRAAGAHLAQSLGDVIVMDDGHQNFTLAKDLALVVVDGEAGFGNGEVMPAGPLREPVAQGLARADAVVISGEGDVALGRFAGQVLRVRLKQAAVELRGRRVVAFAGIGRPDKFFHAMEQQGAVLVGTRHFADHHAYSQAEIARLKSKARALDAELVTTEKDFVRLTQSERDGISALPVRAEFESPEDVAALLDSLPQPG
ncbi:MAG: tetraacyldisaccharide 4'-kinase [Alphaproteobacteria bacterium]|nr:tetraacyldisaccharide 4'-kinase [Alphaproteobacteria bacterium]MBV9693750.1 tetraacyldisaccharide 4'-kinase [Alphaproteobacteria bacterium]